LCGFWGFLSHHIRRHYCAPLRPLLRRRAHLKIGHRLKATCCILMLLAHVLKSHKSSTNSIILEPNYKDRADSPLYYFCLYRIFKCFLVKLRVFQNGVSGKEFWYSWPKRRNGRLCTAVCDTLMLLNAPVRTTT
jgi:hypothetical protein